MVKHIVCAVDGSEHSDKAVELAADLAVRYDAELSLLHVFMSGMTLSELNRFSEHAHLKDLVHAENSRLSEYAVAVAAPHAVAYIPSPSDEVVARIGKVILEDARQLALSKTVKNVSINTANGSPAEEIINFAQAKSADMLVIGSRGLGSFKSIFLGSVSHKVTHAAQCTCITVK